MAWSNVSNIVGNVFSGLGGGTWGSASNDKRNTSYEDWKKQAAEGISMSNTMYDPRWWSYVPGQDLEKNLGWGKNWQVFGQNDISKYGTGDWNYDSTKGGMRFEYNPFAHGLRLTMGNIGGKDSKATLKDYMNYDLAMRWAGKGPYEGMGDAQRKGVVDVFSFWSHPTQEYTWTGAPEDLTYNRLKATGMLPGNHEYWDANAYRAAYSAAYDSDWNMRQGGFDKVSVDWQGDIDETIYQDLLKLATGDFANLRGMKPQEEWQMGPDGNAIPESVWDENKNWKNYGVTWGPTHLGSPEEWSELKEIVRDRARWQGREFGTTGDYASHWEDNTQLINLDLLDTAGGSPGYIDDSPVRGQIDLGTLKKMMPGVDWSTVNPEYRAQDAWDIKTSGEESLARLMQIHNVPQRLEEWVRYGEMLPTTAYGHDYFGTNPGWMNSILPTDVEIPMGVWMEETTGEGKNQRMGYGGIAGDWVGNLSTMEAAQIRERMELDTENYRQKDAYGRPIPDMWGSGKYGQFHEGGINLQNLIAEGEGFLPTFGTENYPIYTESDYLWRGVDETGYAGDWGMSPMERWRLGMTDPDNPNALTKEEFMAIRGSDDWRTRFGSGYIDSDPYWKSARGAVLDQIQYAGDMTKEEWQDVIDYASGAYDAETNMGLLDPSGYSRNANQLSDFQAWAMPIWATVQAKATADKHALLAAIQDPNKVSGTDAFGLPESYDPYDILTALSGGNYEEPGVGFLPHLTEEERTRFLEENPYWEYDEELGLKRDLGFFENTELMGEIQNQEAIDTFLNKYGGKPFWDSETQTANYGDNQTLTAWERGYDDEEQFEKDLFAALSGGYGMTRDDVPDALNWYQENVIGRDSSLIPGGNYFEGLTAENYWNVGNEKVGNRRRQYGSQLGTEEAENEAKEVIDNYFAGELSSWGTKWSNPFVYLSRTLNPKAVNLEQASRIVMPMGGYGTGGWLDSRYMGHEWMDIFDKDLKAWQRYQELDKQGASGVSPGKNRDGDKEMISLLMRTQRGRELLDQQINYILTGTGYQYMGETTGVDWGNKFQQFGKKLDWWEGKESARRGAVPEHLMVNLIGNSGYDKANPVDERLWSRDNLGLTKTEGHRDKLVQALTSQDFKDASATGEFDLDYWKRMYGIGDEYADDPGALLKGLNPHELSIDDWLDIQTLTQGKGEGDPDSDLTKFGYQRYLGYDRGKNNPEEWGTHSVSKFLDGTADSEPWKQALQRSWATYQEDLQSRDTSEPEDPFDISAFKGGLDSLLAGDNYTTQQVKEFFGQYGDSDWGAISQYLNDNPDDYNLTNIWAQAAMNDSRKPEETEPKEVDTGFLPNPEGETEEIVSEEATPWTSPETRPEWVSDYNAFNFMQDGNMVQAKQYYTGDPGTQQAWGDDWALTPEITGLNEDFTNRINEAAKALNVGAGSFWDMLTSGDDASDTPLLERANFGIAQGTRGDSGDVVNLSEWAKGINQEIQEWRDAQGTESTETETETTTTTETVPETWGDFDEGQQRGLRELVAKAKELGEDPNEMLRELSRLEAPEGYGFYFGEPEWANYWRDEFHGMFADMLNEQGIPTFDVDDFQELSIPIDPTGPSPLPEDFEEEETEEIETENVDPNSEYNEETLPTGEETKPEETTPGPNEDPVGVDEEGNPVYESIETSGTDTDDGEDSSSLTIGELWELIFNDDNMPTYTDPKSGGNNSNTSDNKDLDDDLPTGTGTNEKIYPTNYKDTDENRDEIRFERLNEIERLKNKIKGYESPWSLAEERKGLRSSLDNLDDLDSDAYNAMLAGQSSYNDLSGKALDDAYLQQRRGFYSGLNEVARKNQLKAAEEKLNREFTQSGASPEQLAVAKANLRKNDTSREDLLQAAQMSEQSQQARLEQMAAMKDRQLGLLETYISGRREVEAAKDKKYEQISDSNWRQMEGLGQILAAQFGLTETQIQDILARDTEALTKYLAEKENITTLHAAQLSKPDSGGNSGMCCWIMLEARYGDGTMDLVVRKYRDEHMTDKNRRGYYKFAEFIIPLMRRYKVVHKLIQWTFGDTLVAYGRWHYGLNKWGWIFSPIKSFWMGLFNVVGKETEFIRENGEVV